MARAVLALRQDLADGKAHHGRNLLGVLEVLMRGGFETLALERDDALIALHIRT